MSTVDYEEKYKKRMVLGQDGNQLLNLIILIAVMFVVMEFVLVIYKVTHLSEDDFKVNVYNKFILPGSFGAFLRQPWTVFTFMFLHYQLIRVLGNLLWLWAFGFIMQDLMGNKKIIPLFLYGGLIAAVFFMATNSIFFPQQPATLQGASPGILAIAIAATIMAPRYKIFPMLSGGIPLWVLTAIFVVIDFASINIRNQPEQVANVMGGLMGFIYVYQLRRGRDLGAGLNTFFDFIGNLFNPSRKPAKKETQKHFYKVGGTDPYKKVPNITQARIDALLDKISQKGYRSLSEEEKDILKRASEDDNL